MSNHSWIAGRSWVRAVRDAVAIYAIMKLAAYTGAYVLLRRTWPTIEPRAGAEYSAIILLVAVSCFAVSAYLERTGKWSHTLRVAMLMWAIDGSVRIGMHINPVPSGITTVTLAVDMVVGTSI